MSNTASADGAQNNKKDGKGGCLMYGFAGTFLIAGLAVMVFVAIKPLFHYWQSGSWDRVPAKILSNTLNRHYSEDSITYSVDARYRYTYRGQRFTGYTVSLYGGSDNVEDYWQRLNRRLSIAREQNRTVRAWVNPDNPGQAYLDRTLRPGSLIFGFVFGGVFMLVGGGLMFLFSRGDKAQSLVSETGLYASEQSSGHGMVIGIGIMLLLMPLLASVQIWEHLKNGNYGILFVLLFSALGLVVIVLGWRARQAYLFFGPTPLKLDPEPGHAGGQVGGLVSLGRPLSRHADLNVCLTCLRGREVGSGEDRRIEEDVLWQSDQRAWCQPGQTGSDIQFCFDVPEDQPATTGSGRNYILWRVELEGLVDDRALTRSWEIPVQAGVSNSRFALPESHRNEDRREREVEALESANQQIEVEQTGEGLHLVSRAGRNLGMKLGLLVFGSIFAGVGTVLFVLAAKEGFMLYIMGSIFGLIGYLIVFSTLYTLGRRLDAWVRGGEVRNQRRWLGIPVARREGRLLNADQLVLESGMSSTSNGRKTEYMTLYAKVDGKKLRLAEGIAGREAGEALREAVLRTLRLV
ncbi:DUF3592 domain-containing protein [Alcanivorax sp.]|uniref:DUF3592 domain-containing protein n=1 Tax=Alcanivorax sp. TaxID=1872427 RepID=UPI003A901CAD